MTKLNKALYKLLFFIIIVISIITIFLNKTYCLNNFRSMRNEFIGIANEKEVPPEPVPKPGETPIPKTPDKPTGKTPKTGDDSNPRLWLITLAVSVFIIRYILFFKKREEILK